MLDTSQQIREIQLYLDAGDTLGAITVARRYYQDARKTRELQDNDLIVQLFCETYSKAASKDLCRKGSDPLVIQSRDMAEVEYMPSAGRHYVFRVFIGDQKQDYVLKVSMTEKSLDNQINNLKMVERVNTRVAKEAEEAGFVLDDYYIRTNRLVFPDESVGHRLKSPEGDLPAIGMTYIPGDNLYTYIKRGIDQYEHYESAIVQIARLMVEGRAQTANPIPAIDPSKRGTKDSYVNNRLRYVRETLKQFAGVVIDDDIFEMAEQSSHVIEDRIDVFKPLFYYDGNPRNIVIGPPGENGQFVSLVDIEDNRFLPPNLPLASLFEYCENSLTPEQKGALIRRMLVEIYRAEIIADTTLDPETKFSYVRKIDDDIKRPKTLQPGTYEDIERRDSVLLGGDLEMLSHKGGEFMPEDLFSEFYKERVEENLSRSMPYAGILQGLVWCAHKKRFEFRSRKEGSKTDYMDCASESIVNLSSTNILFRDVARIKMDEKTRKDLMNFRVALYFFKEPLLRYDAHVHTTYSDGDNTIHGLINNADRCGVKHVGITDHDTCLGYEKANALINFLLERSDKLGKDKLLLEAVLKEREWELNPDAVMAILRGDLDVFGGLELTTVWHEHDMRIGVHLLGYGVDPEIECDPRLRSNQRARDKRSEAILGRYDEIKGLCIDRAKIHHDGPFLTRWHIANYLYEMFKAKKAEERIAMGFPELAELGGHELLASIRRQTAREGFAHVAYHELEPEITFLDTLDGADLLNQYNAKIVLAHAGDICMQFMEKKEGVADPNSDYTRESLELLFEIMDKLRLNHGLWGVELYCSQHNQQQAERIQELMKRTGLELKTTFGTDFHGKIQPEIPMGTLYYEEDVNLASSLDPAIMELLKHCRH